MAKNKQDVIDEGRAAWHADIPKACPYAATSWQGKAWAFGFEEAADGAADKAEGIRIAAEIENEADARRLETVGSKAPKIGIYSGPRLSPPNSMFHAFTDTPPQIVMQHVNRLSAERAVETDARRRSRLLKSVNRIVDRWNKKATLRRMAEVRAYDKGRAV